MTTLYNTKPADIDICCNEGDVIDMDFFINDQLNILAQREFFVSLSIAPANGTPFNMQILKMQVRRKDYLLLKDWLSGISPSDIVISNPGEFHLFDDTGFLESGHFDYELQCNNGLGYFTIMKGSWQVKKQITV
jgi:hypothetical protein